MYDAAHESMSAHRIVGKQAYEPMPSTGGHVISNRQPSEIERVMAALVTLENQIDTLIDLCSERLERGGVLQDAPRSPDTPPTPSGTCRLAEELLARGRALESFALRLQALLERLVL